MKVIEVNKRNHVIRKMSRADVSIFRDPCYLGHKGFALCGVLHKGETLDEFIASQKCK